MTDDKIIVFPGLSTARFSVTQDTCQDFPVWAVAKAHDASQASVEAAKGAPLLDALRQVFSYYPKQDAIKGAVTVEGCIVYTATYTRACTR